jgi:hypothetical protein
MFGLLALTPQEYVVCQDDFPDEFLDLAVACQNPILPVFAPYKNAYPSLVCFRNTFCFRKVDLSPFILRC